MPHSRHRDFMIHSRRRRLQANHVSKKHILAQVVEADVILDPGSGMSIELDPSPLVSQQQPDAFQDQVPLEQPGGALQLGPTAGLGPLGTSEAATRPQATLGTTIAAESSPAVSTPVSVQSTLATPASETSLKNTLLVTSSSVSGSTSTSSSTFSEGSSHLASLTSSSVASTALTSSDVSSSSSSKPSSVLSASITSTSSSAATSTTSGAPTTTGSASRGAEFYIGTVFGVIIALACLISFAAWLVRSRKGSYCRWWGANDDDSVNFDAGHFSGLEKGLDTTTEWPLGDTRTETRRAGSLIIPDPLPLPPRIQIDMPTPAPFMHARYPQPRPLPSHLHSAESLSGLGSVPRPLLVTNMVPGDIRSSGSSLGSPVFAHERAADYLSVDNSTASLVHHAAAPGVDSTQNSLQYPSNLSLSAPMVTNSVLPSFFARDRVSTPSSSVPAPPAQPIPVLSHKISVASKTSASSSDRELLPLPGEGNSSAEVSESEDRSKESWGASLRYGLFSAISAMTRPSSGSNLQPMDNDGFSPEPTKRLKRIDRRDIDELEPELKADGDDVQNLDRLKDLSALGISLRGETHLESKEDSESPKSPETAPLSITKKKSSKSVAASKATPKFDSTVRPSFLKRGSTQSSGLSSGSEGMSGEENRAQLILALRERRKKGMGIHKQGTRKLKKSVRSTKSSSSSSGSKGTSSKQKEEEPQDTLADMTEIYLH